MTRSSIPDEQQSQVAAMEADKQIESDGDQEEVKMTVLNPNSETTEEPPQNCSVTIPTKVLDIEGKIGIAVAKVEGQPGKEEQVIVNSVASQPGAYPHGLDCGITDRCAPSLQFGLSTEFEETPLAMPVMLPTETAKPVQVDEATKEKPPQEENNKRPPQWQLISLGVVVCLLVLVAVGLTAGLVTRNKNNSDDTSSNELENTNTTLAPTEWTWDLPFEISDTTLRTLLLDTEGISPQSRAYQWIKQDPNYLNYTDAKMLQRFVMATFYYATNGEEWKHQGGGNTSVTTTATSTIDFFSSMTDPPANGGNTRWLRRKLQGPPPPPGGGPPPPGGGGPDASELLEVAIASEAWLSYEHSECDWYSTASLKGNELCGEHGGAEYMSLMSNDLGGQLPPELGLWTTLRKFSLGRNKIGGTIPIQLGSLPLLYNLRLFSNQFNGNVPSQFGLLSDSLMELSVMDNDLTGRLPREIWRLSKLEQFWVGNNDLSGSLPPGIGDRMPNVQLFMMERNRFSGTLPTTLGLLQDAVTIHVGENEFTGTLPSELGLLQNVTRLFLKNNQFTGAIPSQLGQLPRLKELKVEGNAGMGGSFPSELGNLNGTLTHLVLDGTAITGTIPSQLCGIFKLQFDCSPTLCGCDCTCG